MPKKNIEIGRTPNDGTGDNLKIVIAKVNENIDDIYIEKQDTLVSGTNIKTINSASILGSGNIALQGSLVSGTNIKTINGSSVLGSGDLVISGGGSGLLGVHSILPLLTNNVTNLSVNISAATTAASSTNRITLMPYIPAQTFTTLNLMIQVTTLVAGANARILIYSDVNGIPTTKLYESANLDCSTVGVKTATTSFTFNAGTRYWLATHTSATITLSSLPLSGVMPVVASITNPLSGYILTAAFGSAPLTIPSTGGLASPIPQIFITKA